MSVEPEGRAKLLPTLAWPALALLLWPAFLRAQQAPEWRRHADHLESAIPAVVTIAVAGREARPRAYGFGSAADDSRSYRGAYVRGLDLSRYASSGSGFVIARSGTPYIVTNAHVIEAAPPDSIFAFSVDRTRYRVELVGADSFRDVAVLRFVDSPGPELATLRIHRADDLRIGVPVFAIGNPLGAFPFSVTSGVIGGLNRTLDGLTAREGYLQTDATLIWGNSGGPLLGPEGDVVGLNSRIHLVPQLDYFPAPQINFALEGRFLARIVEDIIRSGSPRRAFLGGVFKSGYEGPILVDTLSGAPLADAAVTLPALVVSVDGQRVEALSQLRTAFELVAPGDVVRLAVETATGSERTLSLRTVEGTAPVNARVGRHVVESALGPGFSEIHAPDGTSVEYGDVGRTLPSEAVVYVPGDDAWERNPDPEQRRLMFGDRIRFAGYFYFGEGGSESWESFWQVSSFAELATVARIVGPLGWLSFGLERNGEPFLVTLRSPLTLVY